MADIIRNEELKQTKAGDWPVFEVKDAARNVPAYDAQHGGEDRVRTVAAYDFKHPARVNKTQLRFFEMLHDNLARLLGYTFSRLMRSPVEVKMAFVDQTTYREAMESLGNPSFTYQFRMNPCKGHAFMDFELPLVFGYLDKRFGGKGDVNGQEPRSATPIEVYEFHHIARKILSDLEATWEPIIQMQIQDIELETNPDFMQITNESEIVLLISFEVNDENVKGRIKLCYPYFTIQSILKLLDRPANEQMAKPTAPEVVLQNRLRLGQVPLQVEVELGRASLSAAEVRGLRVGDVLATDTRSSEPATILLNGKPKYYGRPFTDTDGRQKVRLAGEIAAG